MCDGTYNVLEAAHLAGVKRFVTASSASIYGLADTFPTTEDHHPYNNRTWYGASKIMLEGLLRSFNDMYGTSYVAFSYFNADVAGMVLTVFAIAITVAEVAVGLALVIVLFRSRKTALADHIDWLKG